MQDSVNAHYYYWVDLAKTAAIIAVITIHVSGVSLFQFGTIPISSWWIGNIFDGASRFCVPLFIMINGMLLLSKKIPLKTYYYSRFKRLILPLVFWSCIYLLFHLIIEFRQHQKIDYTEIVSFILSDITRGISPHFWFVYVIVLLNALMPIYTWLNKIEHKLYQAVFLTVWIIYLGLFQIFPGYITCYWFTYFIGFLGFPLLGSFVITNFSVFLRKQKLLIGIVAILATLFTIAFTYLLSVSSGTFQEAMYSSISINVMLSSLCLFVLFWSSDFKNTKTSAITKTLGSNSYGIYFSHILVLWFLGKAGLSWNWIHPLIGIPVTVSSCLLLSMSISYGIKGVNKFILE